MYMNGYILQMVVTVLDLMLLILNGHMTGKKVFTL